MDKERPKTIINMFNCGLFFDETCLPNQKKRDKTADVPHYTPTDIHAEDNKSMHHSIMCLKSPVFTSVLRTKWSALQRNFSPPRKKQPKAWAAKNITKTVFSGVIDGIVLFNDTAQNTS